MIALFNASEADKRLIPGGRFDGPTGWLIAIMTFVMVLVASAGLALGTAVHSLQRGAAGDVTIEVEGGAKEGPRMVAAIAALPGVETVEAVPEAELRKALTTWLGPDVAGTSAGIPLPLLVDVSMADGASLDQLAATASRIAPGARLVRHSQKLAPLRNGLSALVAVSALLVLLVAGGTATAVVLATRSALDTHRATLTVMHGIGATDEQVAHLFQRKIALDSLAGGAAGALAAAILLSLFATLFAGSIERLIGAPLLGLWEILLLLGLPVALASLATWVARRTVLATLGEQP